MRGLLTFTLSSLVERLQGCRRSPSDLYYWEYSLHHLRSVVAARFIFCLRADFFRETRKKCHSFYS